MPQSPMSMILYGQTRRIKGKGRTKKRIRYYDPMSDVTRTTVGGVKAMVAVTVGTTVLKAIRG